MAIQIYPAIDLRGGKCVRLTQGDFNKETVYNEDPAAQARLFAQAGAKWLHVVDLDGAVSGKFINKKAVAAIVAEAAPLGVKVQTGGGVRGIDDIRERLDIGCSRVIIGSRAIGNIEFVAEAARLFDERIAVGIDAKGGMAAGAGWAKASDVPAVSLIAALASIGACRIIYTDIAKDGMMSGPNFSDTKTSVEVSGQKIIASGGVSSVDDIRKLEAMGCEGVIVGIAFYKGVLDPREVIKMFEG